MGLLDAVVVFVVLLGPCAWLRRTSSLPSGWHPLLVLSGASLLVLGVGMIAPLSLGVVLAVGSSLALLGYEVWRGRGSAVASVRDPVLGVWFLTVGVLAVVLHGQLVTHYDNFSHWALVIAVMLEDGRLPSGEDAVMGFPTYPLGASSLGYLATKVLGEAEGSSMLAQAAFVSSAALPVASLARRRWPVGVGLYLVAALVLLTAISGPTNLLVDSLVAALAGALLVLITVEPDAVPRHPWAFALLASALVMTKSSGALFVGVAVIVAVVLLIARRDQLTRATGLSWLAALAAPWVMVWWWGRHVAAAYPDAGSTKHSGSSEHLSATWAEKSPADRRGIIEDLLSSIAGDGRLWVLLLVLLLAGAAAVRTRGVEVSTYRLLLGTALLVVVLWEVGLGVMYLWSMPLPEALVLAGFRRYQLTVHLVIAVLVLALSARAAAAARPPRVGAVAVVVAVASLVPLSMIEPATLRSPALDRLAARAELASVLAGTNPRASDTVCLLLEDEDGGYRTWITRYLLLHQRVRSDVLDDDATGLPERLDRCSVLVLLDERASTAEAVRADGLNFPADRRAPAMIEP